VLAQHNEDIAWSDSFANLRTVYCKGADCADGTIRLPNVGREGHTFLKHIVDRYDSLADWTVFSQAEAPTAGYFGAGHERRGHMLGGVTFMDYLKPSPDTGMKFYLTSQVHVPTLRHSLRSTFQVSPDQVLPGGLETRGTCPATTADRWNSFEDMPELRKFLSSKCGLEEWVLADAIRMFWDEYLETELPAGEIVQYAQGARFALSQETIRARPKAFYTKLLEALSADTDPCANYIMEWAWYYVFAPTVQTTPCKLTQTIIDSSLAGGVRSLRDGGVSGSTTAAPAPEPVIVRKKVTKVSSSAALTVEDPVAACANEAFVNVFCTALEGVLGVRPDCTCEVPAAARRLDASARSLAGTVDMLYTITIEEEVDESGEPVDSSSSSAALVTSVQTNIAAASQNTAVLTNALQTALTEAQVQVTATVASVAAPETVEETVTMTQTVTSSTMTTTETTTIATTTVGEGAETTQGAATQVATTQAAATQLATTEAATSTMATEANETTTTMSVEEGTTRLVGSITVEITDDSFNDTESLESKAEESISSTLNLGASDTVEVQSEKQESSGRRLAAVYILSYTIELQDATYEAATAIKASLTADSSAANAFLDAFQTALGIALDQTVAATGLTTPNVGGMPEESTDSTESSGCNAQLGGAIALAASVCLALIQG